MIRVYSGDFLVTRCPFDVILLFQKLLSVIDELESLQPEFRHQLGELEKVHTGNQQYLDDGLDRTPYGSELSCLRWPAVNNKASLGASLGFDSKQVRCSLTLQLLSV